MDLSTIVEAKIHPAIGIARVGNSDDAYFIGTEVPNPVPAPEHGYKDKGRLKRQAARFRVYGYDAAGRVVAELNASNADVHWTVHVANKKAAWYEFDAAMDLPNFATLKSCRRNASIRGADRQNLIIDPGPRSISGRDQTAAAFDTGKFFSHPVYLGELKTDSLGRLIFLGGRGKSGTPFPENTLTTFANNPGWHDDTSDGPVTATVKIGECALPVDSAWVITAPPNYAPDIVSTQTMYDLVYDTLQGGMLPAATDKPSFMKHILPIFQQLCDVQWVNYGFFVQFGWQAPYEFLRPDFLPKLAAPGDQYKELRQQIFYNFRDPNSSSFSAQQWPPIYGDAFFSYDTPPNASDAFAITGTRYQWLQQWAAGNFEADYDPNWKPPESIDDVPLADQPDTLDRAALHFCMGGPFHPGCEMTWPMRQFTLYRAPFRIRHRPEGLPEADYGDYMTQDLAASTDGPLSAAGPGDITRWMAVPWQTDTASCRSGYKQTEFPADNYLPSFWPSRVPNHVLAEEDFQIVIDPNRSKSDRIAAFNRRKHWLRGLNSRAPYISQITKMVSDFGELGVLTKREVETAGTDFPNVMFVETEAAGAATPRAMAAAADFDISVPVEPAEESVTVSEEFSRARSAHLRRRR